MELERPQFFKVILAENILQGKLGIPKTFIRKYGSMLQNHVILRVLPNTEWEVGLTKFDDGRVYLSNGWKQFVEFYSFDDGYFLIFMDQGKCCFDVIILDTTGSEIYYPYYSNCGKTMAECETDESEGSPSVEIIDVIKPCTKRKQKKAPLTRHLRPRIIHDAIAIDRSTPNKIQRGLTAKEKAICQEIADGFVSNHPFFVVPLPVSSVCGTRKAKPMLTIPLAFYKKYLKKDKDSLILVNQREKTWPASYFYSSRSIYARLYNGWMEFAEDNHLQFGDVCAFELIDSKKFVLRITVFPYPENGNSTQCAEYLTHEIIIQPWHQQSCGVALPWNYTEKLVKQTNVQSVRALTLLVGEKSWTVKFSVYPQYRTGRLSCGWAVFSRDNYLQVGDSCVLKLIDEDNGKIEKYCDEDTQMMISVFDE
ncbi:hypothetical protein ACFE04_023894 [Oxalis oulophora]